MKLILLDHADCSIEVIPISEAEYLEYGGDEGFDAPLFLSQHNHFLDNISWMLCDMDPDEVPVYYYNESIPVTVL